MSNIPGSEEITDLLIKAGVDLDTINKLGMTAADKCVVSDNINALKVLVDAGASINNTLKLARDKGRTEIIEYLEASVEDQVEYHRRRLEDLEEIQRKKIEAKRNDKKRKLDQEQKDIRTNALKVLKETEEAEKMIEKLNNSINDVRKMEKNAMALSMEVQELDWELSKKRISRIKADDLAKCLECPVCLDLCRKKVKFLGKMF